MAVDVQSFASGFRAIECYEAESATHADVLLRDVNFGDLSALSKELSQVCLVVGVGKVFHVDSVLFCHPDCALESV